MTFIGVFLAFLLDRFIDWRKMNRDRRSLLSELHTELVGIKTNLTGEGKLHFPDIWESAVSSGQLRLLNSEQVAKLASVYKQVKGLEYEAKRTRDLAEEYRITDATKAVVPNELRYLWGHYSRVMKANETALSEQIGKLLEEKWWKKAHKKKA